MIRFLKKSIIAVALAGAALGSGPAFAGWGWKNDIIYPEPTEPGCFILAGRTFCLDLPIF